jgi:hypothetical protein
LSDYEAFARIAAARAARKYPVILEMLEQRKLHLTAICEVRDFLTAENHRELLVEVSGQTKLQIREILARRFPRADVHADLKRLPELDPLSPGRYGLKLTLNAEQKEKLDHARALLRHANPAGDLALVVERALDALIAQVEKRRFGQRAPRNAGGVTERRGVTPARRKKARANPAEAEPAEAEPAEAEPAEAELAEAKAADSGPSESIALAPQSVDVNGAEGPSRRRKQIRNVVRRELVARDGACCSFIGLDGRRCQERGYLQFHHRQPWARGGADTLENLALLCQSHNRLLAERDFGKAQVQNAIDQRESARSHEGDPYMGQPRSIQADKPSSTNAG